MATRPPPKVQAGRHRDPNAPRPLHIPSIRPNGVVSIDDLSGNGVNPIWLVTLRGTGTKLVVKAEQENNPSEVPYAKRNMKAISEVMATVSSTAAFLRLEPAELDALMNLPFRPLNLRAAILAARRGEKHLTKMKFDPSFFATSANNVESMCSNLAMSSDARAQAALLFNGLRGNRTAWQTLGWVIIADAIVGNGDRINIARGRVSNFGNLIFSRLPNGQIDRALAYDAYDANSENAKMMFGQGINVSADIDPERSWINAFGRHIRDKASYMGLATKLVDDINEQRMRPLNLAEYSAYEKIYLLEGLRGGWDRQAQRIRTIIASGKGIPSGLMARAQYLGFVK